MTIQRVKEVVVQRFHATSLNWVYTEAPIVCSPYTLAYPHVPCFFLFTLWVKFCKCWMIYSGSGLGQPCAYCARLDGWITDGHFIGADARGQGEGGVSIEVRQWSCLGLGLARAIVLFRLCHPCPSTVSVTLKFQFSFSP